MQLTSERLKIVRVFISSTFRDMHAERDHLVTVVFPELRERIEQLGLEFFDVDLRWGVPSKDANGETANSWAYCKQWIDRVEPFFVCVLGQRYGWVPDPHEILDEHDRELWVGRSVTDMEIRYAVFSQRIRRRSTFYLRQTVVPEPPKTPVEVYREFVDVEPDSATSLAALKREIESSGQSVRRYACKWTGQGFEGMEKFGRLVLEDLWSGVLRDERYVSKDVWCQALGGDPDGDPRYTDESVRVPADIAAKIVALAKPPPKDPLDAEREQMDAFGASRLRWFQGRTHELQMLTDFVASSDENAPRLAVVAAVPGQGKSALLAKLSEIIRHPPADVQHPVCLITHFVGATERSASAHALVGRLLDELDRSGIEWAEGQQKDGEEPKRDFNRLSLRLAQRLGHYAGERRVVILLDALNQLTDGHDLSWLPHRLGPSVRMVVSCVDDRAAKEEEPDVQVIQSLVSRQASLVRVLLGPLKDADARTIAVAYLKEYCHELDREHLDTLCAIPQAHNPLYLLVMLNELRTLGGNDLNRIVPELIASMPKKHPDTVSLFRWVLQRLEVFGPDAVRWWCLYLAHGRAGMASRELADLLARKFGSAASATALRIERGLRRYLQRRGSQLDFFHGQLRQAVMARYGSQPGRDGVHGEMADYFTACAKGTDPQKEWETESVRGFGECVFHRTKAGQHEQAVGLLSNFPFLLHKLRVGLLEGVFEDYDFNCGEAPADIVRRVESWADFFREKAHILRRGDEEWPAYKILLQLAVEHADEDPLTIRAEQWLEEGSCTWLWLCKTRRLSHARKSQCQTVLEGHWLSVGGALLLPDGRLLSWSADNTLRVWDGRRGICQLVLKGHSMDVEGAIALPSGQILSWSGDNTLRVWDSQAGECRAVLKGHTQSIAGAQALPDKRLLSWSWDRTLRLWSEESGECLAVLAGHTNHVIGASVLPNNRLVSWSAEDSLRLWDANTGACVAQLEGHTRFVDGARALRSGRILSWSSDYTLRLWDGLRGGCVSVLQGHTSFIKGAIELSDGRILSWSMDHTLRLWDSTSGVSLSVLAGHANSVSGAIELPDGRILSWSEDKTLRIWRGDRGSCMAVLMEHTSPVAGVVLLSDSNFVSWESGAKTLRLWEGSTGRCLTALAEAHAWGVKGALALPDGRFLSWADHLSRDHSLRLWCGASGISAGTVERESEDNHSDVVSGILALAGGQFLSWSNDKTLRLWCVETAVCMRVFRGHSAAVAGALLLSTEQILSWSNDGSLRVWDLKNGRCKAVFGGKSAVQQALAISGNRILSWSGSEPPRLWDGATATIVAELEGHSGRINGALATPDGRLLTWSEDGTLRLWDARSGAWLAELAGHTKAVEGALVLSDGRLLSWSRDDTLRVWDGTSGASLAVLSSHSNRFGIKGAQELADGRLVSWSGWCDLQLWEGRNGRWLGTLPESDASRLWLARLQGRTGAKSTGLPISRLSVSCKGSSLNLRDGMAPAPLAMWHADSALDANLARPLSVSSTFVAQEDGKICILRLRHGRRYVSLNEAESLLGLPPDAMIMELTDYPQFIDPDKYIDLLKKRVESVRLAENADEGSDVTALIACLKQQGRHSEAAAYEKSPSSSTARGSSVAGEGVPGPEHLDTLVSVNNRAMMLAHQGNLGEAEELLRGVIEARERVLGSEHAGTLASLGNLAFVLASKGDCVGAQSLYERVLSVRERVLGPDHADTLECLDGLVSALYGKGDYASAVPLCERALAVRERVLGPEHADTLASLSNLARLATLKGDYAAAEPLCRRALEIRQRVRGPEHADTLGSLKSLGSLLSMKGDYAAAQSVFEQVLAARDRLLGSQHPDTLASVVDLALVFAHQCDYAAAQPLLERELRGLLEVSASTQDLHPQLQTVVDYYCANLRLLNRSAAEIRVGLASMMEAYGMSLEGS